jgi:PPE-repeat protein
MTIDLGALPPEVSSILVYSGPGSTPLVTAASAWNSLAAELSSAAIGYENVVTQLTSEEWLGPASTAAADAVTPYVAWVTNTATQAEQAASQAGSAAAAFETVLASVVPPEAVLTNRAELTQLLSTNVLGQNSQLIQEVESQYGQFWAQNSSALYSYAASSANATQLPKFSAAPQVANPAAAATQGASTAATSVSSIQNQLNQLISQLSTQLSQLLSPFLQPFESETYYLASASSPLSFVWQFLFGTTAAPSNLFAFLTAYSPYASFIYYTEGLPNFSIGIANFLTQTAKTTGALGGAAANAAAALPKSVPALGAALGGGVAHVAGSLGTAPSVGRLSVPVAWNAAVPGAHTGPAAIPVSNIREAPDGPAGNLLGGMPLAGTGAGGGHAGSGPRYGFRPTVMARPPAAG